MITYGHLSVIAQQYGRFVSASIQYVVKKLDKQNSNTSVSAAGTHSAVLVAETDVLNLNDRRRNFTAVHEIERYILCHTHSHQHTPGLRKTTSVSIQLQTILFSSNDVTHVSTMKICGSDIKLT